MSTPEHNRRFRGRKRRRAEANARFAKRFGFENDAAREASELRRDPDTLEEPDLLPAGRIDWLKT